MCDISASLQKDPGTEGTSMISLGSRFLQLSSGSKSQYCGKDDLTEEQTKGALFSAFQLQYLLIDAATEEAWTQPYIGGAHTCLYEVMEALQKRKEAYGRFLSVVQSSGTGKSRMVDELSKQHLVIPINLRPDGERGESTCTSS
jgi:hypothetical protein